MNDQVSQALFYILGFMLLAFFTLLGVLSFVMIKYNKRKRTERADVPLGNVNISSKESYVNKAYNKQSIFRFMEFDKVDDNMIIKKNGNEYLMVIECQGVNYDLMSQVEQAAVEEGFIGFLNALRYPIQIYVQTRTINLEGSIQNYNKRVDHIESNLIRMEKEYETNEQSGMFSKEELDAQYYELTKYRNLYEYGKDIIFNTEQMSLNKNVLNKQYYIITSYYPAEIGNTNFDKEELKNIAFSELYTRCQSIIAALSASGVVGRILGSNSLVDLLYMAYNRDEAEVYGLDKAIEAEYDELYSTAPDVMDKKIAALDREIKAKAMAKAQETVKTVKTEREKRLEEKMANMDDIIDDMAKMIIQENKTYIGKDVAKEAIEKISSEKQQETKEGGETNVEQKPKRTRKPRKTA